MKLCDNAYEDRAGDAYIINTIVDDLVNKSTGACDVIDAAKNVEPNSAVNNVLVLVSVSGIDGYSQISDENSGIISPV